MMKKILLPDRKVIDDIAMDFCPSIRKKDEKKYK